MDDAQREIALRIDEVTQAADLARVRAALVELDPTASARFDAETGIVHVSSTREVLDITATLDRAGLRASAMTG